MTRKEIIKKLEELLQATSPADAEKIRSKWVTMSDRQLGMLLRIMTKIYDDAVKGVTQQ